jgi:hypothetical protein
MFALFIAACTTTTDISQAPLEQGETTLFPAPFVVTADAVRRSLGALDVSIKSQESRSEGTIFHVGRRMNAFSWGQVGRVFVVRSDSQPTAVRTIWGKRATYQFAGWTTERFTQVLKEKVNEVLDTRTP